MSLPTSHRRFLQAAKVRLHLIKVSKYLPASLRSLSWTPIKSGVFRQASSNYRRLYTFLSVRKQQHTLSVERRRQLKLKALAESLFKDKKKSYSVSVSENFIDNRLPMDQLRLLKTLFVPFNVSSSEKIQYLSPVTKFDRHGFKRRKRILVVTDKNVYLVAEEGKSFKLKHKLPISRIAKLEITSEKDNFLLLRIPTELKNQKGDLILEVPFLIEMITKIIKITKKPEILNINPPDSKLTWHCQPFEKKGFISITQGVNTQPEIVKGKQRNLIVIG